MKQKRFLLTVVTALIGLSNVLANDNTFVVNGIEIPEGGNATLEIGLNNPDYENNCYGFQFMLFLPDGVTASNISASDRIPQDYLTQMSSKDGGYSVLSYNSSESVVSGTTGTIVTIVLRAGEGLVNGDIRTGKIKTCKFTTGGGGSEMLNEELSFTITIGEPADPRIILDETSTTPPSASNGAVDVRVKRTIKANEWSTICLPFAMTTEQMTMAFGDDVQLAEFKGWEATDFDDDDKTTAISVKFNDVTAIAANKPYIIKVSNAVSEFTADGVTIDPEDEPFVSMGRINRGTFGSFTGSYVPVTIEEESLFLYNNQFWYSTGNTNMKGYRAYFYFQDVLASYNGNASARINMTIDDSTGISDINRETTDNNRYYDLQGRRVSTPGKGLFVKDGKKLIIK